MALVSRQIIANIQYQWLRRLTVDAGSGNNSRRMRRSDDDRCARRWRFLHRRTSPQTNYTTGGPRQTPVPVRPVIAAAPQSSIRRPLVRIFARIHSTWRGEDKWRTRRKWWKERDGRSAILIPSRFILVDLILIVSSPSTDHIWAVTIIYLIQRLPITVDGLGCVILCCFYMDVRLVFVRI